MPSTGHRPARRRDDRHGGEDRRRRILPAPVDGEVDATSAPGHTLLLPPLDARFYFFCGHFSPCAGREEIYVLFCRRSPAGRVGSHSTGRAHEGRRTTKACFIIRIRISRGTIDATAAPRLLLDLSSQSRLSATSRRRAPDVPIARPPAFTLQPPAARHHDAGGAISRQAPDGRYSARGQRRRWPRRRRISRSALDYVESQGADLRPPGADGLAADGARRLPGRAPQPLPRHQRGDQAAPRRCRRYGLRRPLAVRRASSDSSRADGRGRAITA